MSGREAPGGPRAWGVIALASVACGIVLGAGYALVAPTLAPFAPFALPGGPFAGIAFAAVILLGLGIGHQRPRTVVCAAPAAALIGAAIFGGMIVLPLATPYGGSAVGLTNYAIVQAAFAFFVLVVIAFPGAMVGMLASYFWDDWRG